MNQPNILELIKDAPVEWRTIKDALIRTRGTKITAGKMKVLHSENSPIKIFAGGKTTAHVNHGDIPEKDIHNKPSVIVKSRGFIEFEYYDRPFSHKSELWSYHSDNKQLLIKYVYYYLKINEPYFQALGSRMQMPQIATPDTDNFLIPIPPLAIQQEIVRILDTFTAVTSELTSELSSREKQYNYYRDQLLSFDENKVEWKTLGDVGHVRMCKRVLKAQTSTQGDIPFYKIGTFGKEPDAFINQDLYEEYKLKYNFPSKGTILISASGTIGRTVIYNGEPAYFQDSNIVWLENNEEVVLNKYLYYYYQIANWGASDGGVIKRLYNENLRRVPIQIPSLEEQARIVAILDKFDTLTNSISEGLPREIELRQKQYEYYRNLLLTFPKPDKEAIA